MASIEYPEQFTERIYWLIKLRWIAVLGVVSVVFFLSHVLEFSLPVVPLYTIAVFLSLYNLVFFLFVVSRKSNRAAVNPDVLANAQICLDLFSLAMLIHFSGGIENPFLFYFIFHMVISGILLSRRASFFQASFAAFLFLSLVLLEYAGVISHYHLERIVLQAQYRNPVYITAVSFVFITTLYITAYMTTSISGKLRDRERNLEETNALLKEKDHVKSEYVLRVSHDIKEHLAAIQACLEPVASGITGELNSRQADLVSRALHRTAKLISFVRALLSMTRIRLSKEIKMGLFSLAEVLYDAVTSVSPKARDKNIDLVSSIEPTIGKIRCSREYMQETLVNLLANAVKYTPANGKVEATVNDKGNHVLIKVKDNGIGIPEKDLPRVFEEFFRASNARQVERDGTGLGLSIARQIIELHGGEIWVESEQGRGSVFNIKLPK